jgi:hypothetical protein
MIRNGVPSDFTPRDISVRGESEICDENKIVTTSIKGSNSSFTILKKALICDLSCGFFRFPTQVHVSKGKQLRDVILIRLLLL